ncbi:phytochrome A-associated F-box protein isoform X2 [Rhodamnia argentea]|uniref:Phytochrome A-associated F-box protein isoform X2 n=1 Tax=Rhodamnia argentea TaxID=178133 RepID=A0A8B8Q868_9MYRT|nr:phytochrome A-associated F-box protein isoform X2 [Rhodamnia argentea]
MADTLFSTLSDDVVLNIFSKLEDDPRHWARLACVCTKFSSLIRNVCWKAKCCATIPSVVADLADATSSASSSSPPGGWSSLHKLAVCCPGLLHAGVLLENSDFGLERELGPNEDFSRSDRPQPDSSSSATAANASSSSSSSINCQGVQLGDEDVAVERGYVKVGGDTNACKRRKIWRSMRSHLASGVWNLCREQGNKLLASRFRGDCLYLCDWPGCVHIEEKRNYMLFRGVFKNFKRSMVWRTINDGNRSKIDVNCAFCSCKETWDLHSAFCLRRIYGYHDDGEPVVRAYICENGHVSGAWTDLPLYT